MTGARFPRRARLTRTADFRAVFSDNVRSSGGDMTVLARKNDLGYPRLGLAVSRRAVRRAVDRNRLKRLVRESFRRHAACLQPMDYVVLARSGLERRDPAGIARSLARHWERFRAPCSDH